MVKIRRESGDESAGSSVAFNTSSESGWNGFNFNAPVTTSMNSTTPAFMQSRNQQPPMLELNTTQSMAYPTHSAWPISATSDTFSPTSGMEHVPDFNNPFALNQGYQVNQPALVSPAPLQHSTTFPTSPPFSATSSDHDGRNGSITGRTQSPPFATVANIIRRDGIRKKNARFDIPAERNLKTIDQLINSTNDETELKELKQQKRLLRNRQAALDSRQRKKQHTERLEDEKKHFTAVITELEDALADSRLRETELQRREDAYIMQQQQFQQHFDTLRMQQDELVRQHTIESGELRRKNAMLMDQLAHQSTAMSAAPSSHGINNEYTEFEQMNLGAWNDMNMVQEFTIESQPQDQPHAVAEPEKPAASALLLMLLLCGAWVASRNNSTSTILPAIPDDMRMASANVLTSLYKDSGIQLDGVSSPSKTSVSGRSKTVLSAIESASGFTSSLDSLHQRITSPTHQQLKDQAFGLSQAQYYEMSNGDPQYQQAFFNHQQRNKMSGGPVQQDGSTAETYTRSLLRDKVSTQILKDFARMVTQSNIKSPIPWKSEPM